VTNFFQEWFFPKKKQAEKEKLSESSLLWSSTLHYREVGTNDWLFCEAMD